MIKPSKEYIKVRFDQIVDNITDRIDKPSESGLDYYIGLDHLDTDQIRIKRFGSTSDVEATKFLCKKGDIIFGKRNAYLRKVAVTDRDAVVSAHSMVLRPKGELIVPNFLPCLLQSSTFWKIAFSISEGSMSPTIKWKTLAKQDFLIPHIEQQKKIAELLWAIENNIEKTETLITINEKLKRGLLDELLTKGIGHKKFKKTEIGEIPVEWDLVTIEKVTENLDNKRKPITKSQRESGDVPYYGATGQVDFVKDYIFDEELLLIGEDCADFSAYGNTSYIINGKSWVNNHIHVVKCTKINIIYLKEFINFLDLRIYASGTTRQKLTKGNLSNIKIALPSEKEQLNIVEIIKKTDFKKDALISYLSSLNNLKKKLTDDILKGEVKIK